jgi:hypothetical protein
LAGRCVPYLVKLRNGSIVSLGLRTSLVFCLLIFASCILAPPSSYAEGKNLVFRNPNPDRTWTSQVGGIFTPAKSYALVISISDYVGKENGGYSKLSTGNDAEKMKKFLLQDMGFDYVRVAIRSN